MFFQNDALRSRSRFAGALLVLLLWAVQADAGDADPLDTISGAALRADLSALYDGLQAAHYDLFINRSKSAYDAEFADCAALIAPTQTRLEAWRLLQRFTAFGAIAHATLDFPGAAYGAYRAAGGRTLPIYPRIVAGRVYVDDNYSGVRRLNRGDEILAIDGVPMSVWLERTSRYLSADTATIAHSLLESRFPIYLWLLVGDRKRFTLRVRSPNARRSRRVRVPALTQTALEAAIEQAPARFELDYNERAARVLQNRIAYLRPGPFYNAENPEQLWDNAAFTAFVDTAFATFRSANATSLILDLRANPGGDSSFSDPMLAYLADQPFRFASRFRVRSSAQAEAANRERLTGDSNPHSVSAAYAREYTQTPHGQTFDFELPWAQPRPTSNQGQVTGERFTGRVYALVNRNSYSNAVNVAAILQDYGWAVIAGEATTDYATTLGAMERFTLPNTGFSVGFPKALIIRPSGDTTPGGVVPDLAIESPLIAGADDTVLETLINHIELRQTEAAPHTPD